MIVVIFEALPHAEHRQRFQTRPTAMALRLR